MPTFYEINISPVGYARDGVFVLLGEAARLRRLAQHGEISRSFAISQVRAHLANASLRDRTARRAGFRLA